MTPKQLKLLSVKLSAVSIMLDHDVQRLRLAGPRLDAATGALQTALSKLTRAALLIHNAAEASSNDPA